MCSTSRMAFSGVQAHGAAQCGAKPARCSWGSMHRHCAWKQQQLSTLAWTRQATARAMTRGSMQLQQGWCLPSRMQYSNTSSSNIHVVMVACGMLAV